MAEDKARILADGIEVWCACKVRELAVALLQYVEAN